MGYRDLSGLGLSIIRNMKVSHTTPEPVPGDTKAAWNKAPGSGGIQGGGPFTVPPPPANTQDVMCPGGQMVQPPPTTKPPLISLPGTGAGGKMGSQVPPGLTIPQIMLPKRIAPIAPIKPLTMTPSILPAFKAPAPQPGVMPTTMAQQIVLPRTVAPNISALTNLASMVASKQVTAAQTSKGITTGTTAKAPPAAKGTLNVGSLNIGSKLAAGTSTASSSLINANMARLFGFKGDLGTVVNPTFGITTGINLNKPGTCVKPGPMPTACGAGQMWDTVLGRCKPSIDNHWCPSGFDWDNTKGMCNMGTCPDGYTLNAAGDQCVENTITGVNQCNPGYVYDSGFCVPAGGGGGTTGGGGGPTCPAGYTLDPTSGQCVSAPAVTPPTTDPNTGKPKCQPNFVMTPSGQCVSLMAGGGGGGGGGPVNYGGGGGGGFLTPGGGGEELSEKGEEELGVSAEWSPVVAALQAICKSCNADALNAIGIGDACSSTPDEIVEMLEGNGYDPQKTAQLIQSAAADYPCISEALSKEKATAAPTAAPASTSSKKWIIIGLLAAAGGWYWYSQSKKSPKKAKKNSRRSRRWLKKR